MTSKFGISNTSLKKPDTKTYLILASKLITFAHRLLFFTLILDFIFLIWLFQKIQIEKENLLINKLKVIIRLKAIYQ